MTQIVSQSVLRSLPANLQVVEPKTHFAGGLVSFKTASDLVPEAVAKATKLIIFL